MSPAATLKGCFRWSSDRGRRRRESNPCTGLCTRCSLSSLDPEHVIYVGTASKTLAPRLRLGWLSVPGSLREPFALAKDRLDRGTSALEQRTFAEFIAGGAFDRHVRRMRSFYHRRRDDLEQAIAGVRPDLRLSGVFVGMHALIYLPSHGPSEHQVLSRAAKQSRTAHHGPLMAQRSAFGPSGNHRWVWHARWPRVSACPERRGQATGPRLTGRADGV